MVNLVMLKNALITPVRERWVVKKWFRLRDS
jgi:hypothetical protein